MKENIQIVFGLLGGLAVFIYGMNMMSECLQKAAGEKMKKILSLLTRNPVMGALAGMLDRFSGISDNRALSDLPVSVFCACIFCIKHLVGGKK